MLRNLVIGAAIAAVTFAGTTAVQASNDMPGKGVTVQPARATWNTGFFQEALVRKGLETLGFDDVETNIMPMPESERVDIAFIKARKLRTSRQEGLLGRMIASLGSKT